MAFARISLGCQMTKSRPDPFFLDKTVADPFFLPLADPQ
jgi:hypothetical protein